LGLTAVTAGAPFAVAAAATGEKAAGIPPMAVFSKVYQELKLNFQDAAAVTTEADLDGIDCPVRPGGEIEPERAADELPKYAEALRKQGKAILLLTTGIQNPRSAHAEAILRTAKSLGVKYYRLGSWNHPRGRKDPALVAEVRAQLQELAALNRQLGMTGLVQNHTPGGQAYLGGDLVEMAALVAGLNPEEIGVAFDLGHAINVHGDDWKPLFQRLTNHLKVVYVKDVRRGAGFVRFGEGEFGSTDFFRQLRRLNYQAPVSIHIEFKWAVSEGNKSRSDLVKALNASVQVSRKWFSEANFAKG
jgi:sugar phosphate isomerase/epimerase